MGRRGPLPKPADQSHGHRRRRVAKDATVQAPAEPQVKMPSEDWLDSTKAAWAVYWKSDVARVVLDVDEPSIRRLFGLYDQHERAMEVVRKALVVRGSTGQIRTNPLADHALRLEGAILRLEDVLGITPAGRSRLGIGVNHPADRGPVGLGAGRYAHLRVVAP
jgi:phage terminase small subunit